MKMTSFLAFARKGNARLYALVDRMLHTLCVYAVPVAIGVVSLAALFFWENQYQSRETQRVAFHVIKEPDIPVTPAEALTRTGSQPNVLYFDTQLSEAPFWFSFVIKPNPAGMPVSVEFPSRHAVNLSCWDAKSGSELGNANRNSFSGEISPARAGFVLNFPSLSDEAQVLCKSKFSGPARISVNQWASSNFEFAARAFERNSGLLDGGLIVLGVFVLITALINRDSTYILFAAWLLANLRMAALSTGGDIQWLGHLIPPEWIIQIRSLTLACYYVLTVTLFRSLFRDELTRVGNTSLLRASQLTCIPLLLLALFLPYRNFLPLFWTATGFTVIALAYFLSRILIKTRSPVAVWYSASLGITLTASLYEVISAAVGLKGLIDSVNSVTAALSSSLLAALAIAAQLRMKHQKWMDAQAELQHTYDVMPIGLFTLDMTGRFISANPALLSMIGVSEIAIGRDTWDQHFSEDAWPRLHRMVYASTSSELEIQCNDTPECERKRFLVKATLARGRIEGSLQDITARFKATEELRFIANNDPLTKVLNRRGIEAALNKALDQASPSISLALAYLDLDRFKLINDLYGHSAGDDILKQVCGRIRTLLAGDQQIGRVGGDEFVIIFPNTPINVASWVCHSIVEQIGNSPYPIGDKAFQVRGSIGLIEVSPGTKIKDAVSTADRACREAKIKNDGLVVYEKSAAAFREREAELRLVERLANPTGPEGLFLEMQPIMSLKCPHETLNFEVLLRMRNQDGSTLSAGQFIPAAESSGHVGVIDRWVLSNTLDWIKKHHSKLARTQFICMNLSGASLNDEHFAKDAFEILEKNRLAAKMLCLEITESVALHDLANTRRFIDRVRGYGVKIALDDFGAGYTSFSYLKDLPADVLKIDGSFIVSMNNHPANVAIVEAIVNLARNLGMKTVAEWAEDSATVQALVEIGVDYVQGYAISKAQPSEKILSATSSASFIQDPELEKYTRTLTEIAEAPPGLAPVVSLVACGGNLITT
jgi:diguanylate cyclase (GGDEF)-like protein